MPTNRNCVDQLVEVANYLSEQQDAILNRWRASVEMDPKLQIAIGLEPAEFEGPVSSLLRFLNREIRSECILSNVCGDYEEAPVEAMLTQKEHAAMRLYGFSRWQHGYNMQQVILEWAHLNQILVQILNEYESLCYDQKRDENNFGLTVKAIALARLLAAQLCDAGYDQILTEFHQRQQTEVKEIVHNLSNALEQTVLLDQTRGQVLREAVHDLRGNLTAIRSAVSLINTAPPEIMGAVSDILYRGTESLHKMFNEMLDLSRLEAGKEDCHVEDFDASALILEICQNNEPLARQKGINLDVKGCTSLQAEGDVLKIRRVIQNLLLNAVKYTNEGCVTVDWEAINDDYWQLSIQDTGPGFTQRNETHTDALPERGEGIGLIIVRRLCLLLESRLEINSIKGEGTTFQIIWPRHYPTKENSLSAIQA